MNLPVITACGAATLVHERYNAEWIKENNLGLVVKRFKHVRKAVEVFLCAETFERYRANVKAVENRAIFEVADYLQQVLSQADVSPENSSSMSAPLSSLEKPHAAASGR